MSSRSARSAFPLLVFANVALAFGPWLVREAGTAGGIGPVAAGFWRLTLALPFLALLVRASGQRMPVRKLSVWRPFLIAGLFFAGDLAAWHLGIVRTRLANATLFGNVTSFTFPLYGMIAARRWPGRRPAAALLLAMGGMTLLLGRSFELSLAHAAGDLLCILAGLFYTGYLAVLAGRDEVAPLPSLLMATLAGIPVLWLAARAMGEAVWPAAFWPVLLLALGSQVLGQGLVLAAIRHLSATVIGLTLLVQPIVAAAIGRIFFDERLTALDLVGAAIIAVALVLVRLPERRPLPAAPAAS